MQRKLDLIRKNFPQSSSVPSDYLSEHIYNSWERCAEQQLPMTGSMDYKHLSSSAFESLLHKHELLLQSSRKHLDSLYGTLAGAGWSVLITDKNCTVLKVYKSKNIAEKRIMQAFTPGAVLSEELIGTSAMSCTLTAKRLISVFGEEHYKEAHRNFNCVAVPIFDQYSNICGTLDLTNENPVRDPAAFYFLEQCATSIQRSLIYSIPDSIIVELFSDSESQTSNQKIIVVLSYEQQVIGANSVGARFFNLNLNSVPVCYSDLFFDDFSVLFDQGLLKASAFKLTMNNGISLYAQIVTPPSQASRLNISSVSGHLTKRQYSGKPDELTHELGSFGDPLVHTHITKCIKAISRLPVLIQGESGTGKEVAARQIHELSPHKKGRFIAVNCAAIPDSLIESELFGYQGGAFTGANKTGSRGKVEEADGGTLFLDEIGDMPIELQTRLLRVLETKEVNKLGSTTYKKINFQLICATHKNLEKALATGEFRQDLFYRINGMTLTIPPLRERSNVLELAYKVLDQVSIEPRRFDQGLQDYIEGYEWPGNVRELKNALVYADALAESPLLTLDDLPDNPSINRTKVPYSDRPKSLSLIKNYEQLIREAMGVANGDITKAARHMGISRATLYRKLAKMQL